MLPRLLIVATLAFAVEAETSAPPAPPTVEVSYRLSTSLSGDPASIIASTLALEYDF